MSTTKFAIEEMHCGSCISRVTTVLRAIDGVGVEQVAVGSAEVSLDPAKVSAPAVAAALGKAGYPARQKGEAVAAETCSTPASGDKGCGCCGKS